MIFLPLLLVFAYFIAIHYRLESERDSSFLFHRESWPICQNCSRQLPPYNAGVVITWICPHCGESRRRSAVKGKKQTPVDPDF
jgi:predicted RNA-binding Zn-ribbon protein involved in translation (DUF1610 family)